MSDLPEWIKEWAVPPKVLEALAIAWDAFEKMEAAPDEQTDYEIRKDAMRRIEELGTDKPKGEASD